MDEGTEDPPRSAPSGGRARGYIFQDAITGLALLEVLFGQAKTVTIEGSTGKGDKFDDIILEREASLDHFQVKNGPAYTLSSKDLWPDGESEGRGLRLDGLILSARRRQPASGKARFIVLTSYRDVDARIKTKPSPDVLKLLGVVPASLSVLEEGKGDIAPGTTLEFAIGFPHHQAADDETKATLNHTPLFRAATAEAQRLLSKHTTPAYADAGDLVERAALVANHLRGSTPGIPFNRDAIARHLDLAPEQRLIHQDFPAPKAGIVHPAWLDDLEVQGRETGTRLLVEGPPGSGKSTTIRLHEKNKDRPVVLLHLFTPGDRPHETEARVNPAHFREQLAGQLATVFPNAFEPGSRPVFSSPEDIKRYLAAVAKWASQNDIEPIVTVDGLDHALRQYGESRATMAAAGTILEAIGRIDFPKPFTLLLLSRPLPPEAQNALKVHKVILIKPWEKQEIETFLRGHSITPEPAIVDRARDISGGLPVILTHLVRSAVASTEHDPTTGFQSALKQAGTVHGDLQAYYATIWEGMGAVERDAASLIAISPNPPTEGSIRELVPLPWSLRAINESLLSTVVEKLPHKRVRLFHDSFREFVLGKLHSSQRKRMHATVFNNLATHWRGFPVAPREMLYHAEHANVHEGMKRVLTLDNVLAWWKNGAHEEAVLEALRMQFELATATNDAMHALDCVVFGGVCRNVITHELDNGRRLRYFAHMGLRNEGLRLARQMLWHGRGKAAGLTSLIFIRRHWPDEFDPDWLTEWNRARQAMDREAGSDVPVDLLFHAIALAKPDRFWEVAGRVRTEEDEKPFVREALAATEHDPTLVTHLDEPPEWLREDTVGALETTAALSFELPAGWKRALLAASPTIEKLSLASLLGLLRAGGDPKKVDNEARARKLADPQHKSLDPRAPYADSFYLGAILADLGATPADVAAHVGPACSDAPVANQVIALAGASATRRNNAEAEAWALSTLNLIRDMDAMEGFERRSHHILSTYNYEHALRAALNRLAPTLSRLNRTETAAVAARVEAFPEPDNLVTAFKRDMLNLLRAHRPAEAARAELAERLHDLLTEPPEEGNMTSELMDLAAQAAPHDHLLATQAYEAAVQRSFHYGSRKDTWLEDVWDALKALPREDWDDDLGTAIQLLNWSRLLFEITDRKETAHVEGTILTDLLDMGLIDYQSAFEHAMEWSTIFQLRSWRVHHTDFMDEDELENHLRWQLMQMQRPATRDNPLVFLARLAEIAHKSNSPDLAKRALQTMNDVRESAEGLPAKEAEQIRLVAADLKVAVPMDLERRKARGEEFPSNEEGDEATRAARDLLARHRATPLSAKQFERTATDVLVAAVTVLDYEIVEGELSPAPQIAKELAKREGAAAVAKRFADVIAARNAMLWYIGGRGRFQHLVLGIHAVIPDDTLRLVLEAWRRSSPNSVSNMWMLLVNLVWLVNLTEGELAARELMRRAVQWTRRLLQPHDDRIQIWGSLARW